MEICERFHYRLAVCSSVGDSQQYCAELVGVSPCNHTTVLFTGAYDAPEKLIRPLNNLLGTQIFTYPTIYV